MLMEDRYDFDLGGQLPIDGRSIETWNAPI